MLNVGERPTVVQKDEEDVFNQACELTWQHATSLDGSTAGRTKITMDQASVDRLHVGERSQRLDPSVEGGAWAWKLDCS